MMDDTIKQQSCARPAFQAATQAAPPQSDSESSPPAAGEEKGLSKRIRAFVKARRSRVRGFGFLLLYCHMLMLFAFLGRLYLPDLADLAKAVGTAQAWRTETVQEAAHLAKQARDGLSAVQGDLEEIRGSLRMPEEIKDLRRSAADISDTVRNSSASAWIKSKWSGEEEAAENGTAAAPGTEAGGGAGAPRQGTDTGEAAPTATASGQEARNRQGGGPATLQGAEPAETISLPDLASLSGLPLSARISSALVPIMFALATLSLLLPPLFRAGVALGLGHALLSGWLVAKAALALRDAPEFFILCLSGKLRSFASGGWLFWLAGLAGLALLLGLTAWMGRRKRSGGA